MNDLTEMMAYDIFADAKQTTTVKSTTRVMPLISWDIYADFYQQHLDNLTKQHDIKLVKAFAKRFQWNVEIEDLLSTNDYEALVITDKHQQIIWVNTGFTKMTGYTKSYALKQTPSFLQGKQTSSRVRDKIRRQLQQDKAFQEVITNYKKDQTPYQCEVKIIPLGNQQTTHFIALERAVG